MNSESTEQSRPGFFSRLSARIRSMSVAAKVSFILAGFLFVLVIVTWIVFFSATYHVPWRHSMTWLRMLFILILVVVIPLIVYQALKLWLEGESSQFPDIDYAWKAGIAALVDNGISLQTTPIFLIVGSSDLQLERSLMRSADLSLRVKEVPEGPSPIRWYANPSGIYLTIGEAGLVSELTARFQKIVDGSGPGEEAIRETLSSHVSAGSVPQDSGTDADPELASRTTDSTENLRGTMLLSEYSRQSDSPLPDHSGSQSTSSSSPSTVRGTVTLQSVLGDEEEPTGQSSTEIDDEEIAALLPRETTQQVRRLQYVCRLIRKGRGAICPINGILTLVPYRVLAAGSLQLKEFKDAIHTDLIAIRSETGLRSPVTALVTEMENERGFRELVRRVGQERANTQRFGQRFDVQSHANSEELGAFAQHVNGAFEDWIYTLFREQDTLTRPGNTHLYELMCKIRFMLIKPLTEVLAHGFGSNTHIRRNSVPHLFSGCYFAATGKTEDKQAFVKGVFDKLVDQQEDIEWTRESRHSDRVFQRLATTGTIVAILLLCVNLIKLLFFMQ